MQNVEFLQERISKIISQNEAIVENKELLLQKKYPKMGGKSKNSPNSTSSSSGVSATTNSGEKLASTLLSNKQQMHLQNISQPTLQQSNLTAPTAIVSLNHLGYQCDENSGRMIGTTSLLPSNSTINNSSSLSSPLFRVNHQVVNHVLHQSSESSSASVQQPLNLSKIGESQTGSGCSSSGSDYHITSSFSSSKKRSSIDYSITNAAAPTPSLETHSSSPTPTKGMATHPQNPERSIIKHLLLNARGLGVPNGEGEDAVYTCPLCRLDFRTAEELKLHTSNYCQGGPPSAPISPVASPSHKYFR